MSQYDTSHQTITDGTDGSTHHTVSVILTAYSGTTQTELRRCFEGLVKQQTEQAAIEVVIVFDNAPELAADFKRSLSETYQDTLPVNILTRPTDNGLADARNFGAARATGDILAFIDTDAVPAPRWVQTITDTIDGYNATVVGGPSLPEWPAESRPHYLPPEMDWLVGVTHRGFVPESLTDPVPIRNPFGCNIAFSASMFDSVDGFNTEMGKSGNLMQGEEPEICLRIREYSDTDSPVWYHPSAIVTHYISESQTDLSTLLRRAYWQGITKAHLNRIQPSHSVQETTKTESAFLKQLLVSTPQRYFKDVLQPNTDTAALATQFFFVYIFLVCVSTGFVKGSLLPPSTDY